MSWIRKLTQLFLELAIEPLPHRRRAAERQAADDEQRYLLAQRRRRSWQYTRHRPHRS